MGDNLRPARPLDPPTATIDSPAQIVVGMSAEFTVVTSETVTGLASADLMIVGGDAATAISGTVVAATADPTGSASSQPIEVQ